MPPTPTPNRSTAIKAWSAGLAMLILAGCGTVTVDHDGNPDTPPIVSTPEQRCVGYLATLLTFDTLIEDGHELSRVELIAYNGALAGKAATCPPDLTPEAAEELIEDADDAAAPVPPPLPPAEPSR